MSEEDLLSDLGFDEEEIEELKNFTFNKQDKVAIRKPFQDPEPPVNITQVIADKLEQRDVERCTICGYLKQKISSRFNHDGAKFVWRCPECRRRYKKEWRAKKRNEANKS